MSHAAIALGHILLGGFFIYAGVDQFLRFKEVEGMLAEREWPWPRLILAAASAFQIVAGAGLALGVLRPWTALGLAAFTIAATLLLLDFWRFKGPEREGMRSGFVVNLGLLGGLVLAFGGSL